MKFLCVSIFVMALLFLQIHKVESRFNITKIVWLYWNGDLSEAPLIVQHCITKFQKATKEVNWQLKIIKDQNFHQTLGNAEKSERYNYTLLNSEKPNTGPAKADLIRLLLLSEHGGVWFDISSILLDRFKLQWLQNLQRYLPYMMNRNKQLESNPNQHYDVFTFSFGKFQSANIQFKDDGYFTNKYPGFQTWFIAAAKGSQLMNDWWQMYSNFTIIGYNIYHKMLVQEDAYMRYIDWDNYLGTNEALTHLFYLKQKQLDQQTFLLGQRKSAYHYYKIVTMSGEIGPFFQLNQVNAVKLMTTTVQQFLDDDRLLFFIKLNNGLRQHCQEKYLKAIQRTTKLNRTVQQFIQSKPALNECNSVEFVLIDSPIYEIFYEGQHSDKNVFVNKSQSLRWRQYCDNMVTVKSIMDDWDRFYYIQKIKSIQIPGFTRYKDLIMLNMHYHRNQITSEQYLTRYVQIHTPQIKVYIMILTLLVWYLAILYFISLAVKLVFQSRFLVFSTEFNSRYFYFLMPEDNPSKSEQMQNYEFEKKLKMKKFSQEDFIQGQDQSPNFDYSQNSESINQNQSLKSGQIVRSTISFRKNSSFKVMVVLLLRILQSSLAFMLVFCLKWFGMEPDCLKSLMYLVFLSFTQVIIRSMQTLCQKRIFSANLILLNKSIVNFYAAYSVFTIIFNRPEYIVQYSVLYGLIIPSLLDVTRNSRQFQIFVILKAKTLYRSYRKIGISICLIYMFIPNVKFILVFGSYIDLIIAKLVLTPVFLTIISIIGYEVYKKCVRDGILQTNLPILDKILLFGSQISRFIILALISLIMMYLPTSHQFIHFFDPQYYYHTLLLGCFTIILKVQHISSRSIISIKKQQLQTGILEKQRKNAHLMFIVFTIAFYVNILFCLKPRQLDYNDHKFKKILLSHYFILEVIGLVVKNIFSLSFRLNKDQIEKQSLQKDQYELIKGKQEQNNEVFSGHNLKFLQ